MRACRLVLVELQAKFQLLNRLIGSLDGFQAVATEVMGGVFHVCFRTAQGFERFVDFRMLSAGVASGVAASALAAGVAGRLALLGAAGAAAMNSNARMRHARASKLTILVFMNHSSRPNYGSDPPIVPLFPSLRPALDHRG